MTESDDCRSTARDEDWRLGSWHGSRRRQHQEFHALSFREKLIRVEEMTALGRTLADRMRPPDGARPPTNADSRDPDRG